ncbi:hypothetical protein CCP3SC5AM1_3550001 [Gammaproteobacteria bacterium]
MSRLMACCRVLFSNQFKRWRTKESIDCLIHVIKKCTHYSLLLVRVLTARPLA